MQRIFAEHAECLAAHARVLAKVDEAIANHEHEIVKQQKGTSGQAQDMLANQDQEGVFSRHEDAHQRIRNHHQAVMAQLQALQCAAESGM